VVGASRLEPLSRQPGGTAAAAEPVAVVKVIGVGGGGGNALNRMIAAGVRGVEFVALNTDAQALAKSGASVRLQIGPRLTGGLGAGSDPEVGRQAAEDQRGELEELCRDADVVVVTAGEGGGTGTGAAPVLAGVARGLGALTLAVVTRPFGFEGRRRATQAEVGVQRLQACVDTLVVVANDRLLKLSDGATSLVDAFGLADDALSQGVRGITEILTQVGVMNIGAADVLRVLRNAGRAHLGVGTASGHDRARQAARAAITSPLLETSITGAQALVCNIAGPADLELLEVYEIADLIAQHTPSDTDLAYGALIDPSLAKHCRVTVIAAGIDEPTRHPAPEHRPSGPVLSRQHTPAEPHDDQRRDLGDLGDLGDLDVPDFLR
jgi:cell division protein FtsZ